jgi:MFS family permease
VITPNSSFPVTAVLFTSLFLFMTSFTVAAIVVPFAAGSTVDSSFAAGLIIATPGVVGLICALPAAAAGRHFGYRSTVLVGFALLTVATALLASQVTVMLVLSVVALGVAQASFWPSALAALSDPVRLPRLEKVHGVGALVQGLAGLAGGAVAALTLPLPPGFAAAALASSIIASVGLPVAFGLNEPAPGGSRSFSAELRSILSSVPGLLSDRGSLAACTAAFPFTALWWVGGTSFLTLYVYDEGLPLALAGALVAARTITATVLRLGFGSLARRWGVLATHIGGNLVAAVGLAGCALGTDPAWLLACAALQGAGLSVVLPAANMMVGQRVSHEDHTLGYALPFALSQGALMGLPLLLGAVAGWGSIALALIVAAILASLAAVFTWLLGRGVDWSMGNGNAPF